MPLNLWRLAKLKCFLTARQQDGVLRPIDDLGACARGCGHGVRARPAVFRCEATDVAGAPSDGEQRWREEAFQLVVDLASKSYH